MKLFEKDGIQIEVADVAASVCERNGYKPVKKQSADKSKSAEKEDTPKKAV